MSSEISTTFEAEDFVASVEELESFYVILESGNVLDLQWQSPGRRPLSPVGLGRIETNIVMETAEKQEPIKNDFDFNDDVGQQSTHLRVRSQNITPKKKKIANFAGVMEVLKKKNAEG